MTSGRIAIRDREDNQRPAIFDCVLRHSVEKRVADLSAGKIQVGLVPPGQPQQHILQRTLLAEDGELKGLPWCESGCAWSRFDVLESGDINIQPNIYICL